MKKIAFTIATIIFATACFNYSEKEIVEVSNSQEFLLFPNTKNPNDFKIKVFGKTDGNFTLRLLQRRAKSIKKDTIRVFNLQKGNIDTTFQDEWYADTLFLNYQPHNVQHGALKIKYTIN